ncbi:MAG TPA: DUF2239 family protein [Paraburkholderia sp.]|jgi:hypothetical protein|nr:DUF2239 family protein [Paraburkholderia sp.]
MSHESLALFTSFDGHRRLSTGPLEAVALTVKQAVESGASGPVLMFDDTTGRSIDLDLRGSNEDVLARLTTHPAAVAALAGSDAQAAPRRAVDDAAHAAHAEANAPRGRGRPKLGVVAREVTLLPRHWEWLGAQPGGASVVLRKLVEEARRTHADRDTRRATQERTYHFMSAMAGDLPGFEEATRALFATDTSRLRELVAGWPEDVRDHVLALAC